ncbi:MAG: hypothetical protein IJ075_05285 [Lachnospiraceae bacterium]|nr:hypothetical protein [Lachnospiraceae bacterium]MBR1523391.1 hypothetical protein [Lachnospiraceae bacterium]
MKEEKKQLKEQAKELKKQRKALEAEEADADDEGGAFSVILVTVVIILIWLAILALLVKLDVGGFGSNVLAPVLGRVPVVNKILPEGSVPKDQSVSGDNVIEGGYDSLDDAVNRIKMLEAELAEAKQESADADATIDELTQEIARLKTYEDNQVEFEKIKDEFDNEVVFNSKAPDIEEYRKYYEEIDPTNAEILYKEVVKQEQISDEIKDYAKAYSEMKAKDAAVIFNSNPLKNDLELAAKILGVMNADARGSILAEIGKLDADLAGNITEIMDPEDEE